MSDDEQTEVNYFKRVSRQGVCRTTSNVFEHMKRAMISRKSRNRIQVNKIISCSDPGEMIQPTTQLDSIRFDKAINREAQIKVQLKIQGSQQNTICYYQEWMIDISSYHCTNDLRTKVLNCTWRLVYRGIKCPVLSYTASTILS